MATKLTLSPLASLLFRARDDLRGNMDASVARALNAIGIEHRFVNVDVLTFANVRTYADSLRTVAKDVFDLSIRQPWHVLRTVASPARSNAELTSPTGLSSNAFAMYGIAVPPNRAKSLQG